VNFKYACCRGDVYRPVKGSKKEMGFQFSASWGIDQETHFYFVAFFRLCPPCGGQRSKYENKFFKYRTSCLAASPGKC